VYQGLTWRFDERIDDRVWGQIAPEVAERNLNSSFH
jgi:hypothetical protein